MLYVFYHVAHACPLLIVKPLLVLDDVFRSKRYDIPPSVIRVDDSFHSLFCPLPFHVFERIVLAMSPSICKARPIPLKVCHLARLCM